mmetsp:Transcript_72407/g.212159  ORF Transcript_72407/g.212159 Transcript_72407/m.212159 type:complete len:269 (+) Transcript_72407:367-1173(+)
MQCWREMMGSWMTTSLFLSLPMLRRGCAVLRSFSAGRSVFIGDSLQIADSTILGFSRRFTLSSLLPQLQCMRTRCKSRVARFTCSAEPLTFTCASSGAHSTSAPLCSVISCRCSGVIKYSTSSFGTGMERLGRSRLSLEKSIGVVSTLASPSALGMPGTAAPGAPGTPGMPGAPGWPGMLGRTPGMPGLPGMGSFAASMASSCVSADGPSIEVSVNPPEFRGRLYSGSGPLSSSSSSSGRESSSGPRIMGVTGQPPRLCPPPRAPRRP